MKNLVVFKSAAEVNSQQEMLEKFSENGISATFISPLAFSFKNLDSWGKILKEKNSKFTGIIFTSPRSVEASVEALQGGNLHPSWHEADNYCVGPTTSHLVSSKVKLECRGENSGNAEVLSDFILQEMHENGVEKGTFLFPSGNLKLGILERKLQEGGFTVEAVEIYETVANPALEEEISNKFPENAEYSLFYSPSCVNFTLPLIREKGYDLKKLKFLAIGPSTRKAIEEQGLEVFKTCEKPTFDYVLKVLL